MGGDDCVGTVSKVEFCIARCMYYLVCGFKMGVILKFPLSLVGSGE